MFERFNNQSRRVVILAQEEARAFNHSRIGTEHLLLGLLCEGAGTAATALASANVTLDAARQELEAITGRGQQPQSSGHIPFTPRAKKVLELSLRECVQLNDNYIGTGHVLLGLIRQGDGVAPQMLDKLGVDVNDLRERVTQELRDHPERTDGVREQGDLARQQTLLWQRNDIEALLDTIDERLSAIEQHLGITRDAPDELRKLDERIARVRRDKQTAIDVQEFKRAAILRDVEKKLLSERARVEREIRADRGNGDQTGASTDETSSKGGRSAEASKGSDPDEGHDEIALLRARLARLEAQLREHHIDPDEPHEGPPAVAG
jgi:Clp amino terminal domain, pathogenicity island component/UvrB/uvrC motif